MTKAGNREQGTGNRKQEQEIAAGAGTGLPDKRGRKVRGTAKVSGAGNSAESSATGGATNSSTSGAIVECVPNFSEGADAGRVEAIVAAMRVDGVHLLDWSMDADHNRSVVTIAGEPAAVVEAAVRSAGKAVELIDLRGQEGVHPRIGAADVIPFVPVRGIKLEQCVMLARQAGLEIWRRFGVPVYFYEAAAARPDRKNLEDIRRGQFEELRDAAQKDPSRRPDLGGPELHPRGGAVRCWGAQVPCRLQHLLRLAGCGHGPSDRQGDSRGFWRIKGR